MRTLLENKNAVIYGAGGLSATRSPESSPVKARASSSPVALASRWRRSPTMPKLMAVTPRWPYATPSTNMPSTSTLRPSFHRPAASTCPSTSSRAGTCRGYLIQMTTDDLLRAVVDGLPQ